MLGFNPWLMAGIYLSDMSLSLDQLLTEESIESIESIELDGRTLLRVKTLPRDGFEANGDFYVDPELNYLVRKFTYGNHYSNQHGAWTGVFSFECNDFAEPKPGIFFPRKTRLCLKTLIAHKSQVALDEGHFDKAAEVLGRLVEARDDASAFLQPADQLLDDAPPPVRVAIELHGPGLGVFIFLGGNDGRDAQVQQVLVNPIRAIPFVPGQRQGPRDGLSLMVDNFGIRAFQECNQRRRFVVLSGRQVEGERMPVAVAQQVEFCGKTPARAA